MYKVELDELEVNAIGAALDDRRERLAAELAHLMDQPLTAARDFAIDCNLDAVRHNLSARKRVLDAVEKPRVRVFEGMEAYTESELRESYGR